jgi:hypothetical protein
MIAELAGHRVVEARVTVPRGGAWHADVLLDKEAALAATGLVLTLAGLKLSCAPYRTPISFQGTTRVRLIGGAGGWRKLLMPKGYKVATGVRLSLVLGDAARECGEKMVVATDRVLGLHYARDRAPACRLLNRWVPADWWIDIDGTTRTAPRASSAIVSPFSLSSYDGARGVAMIATEIPGDFMPGRTFRPGNMSATLTIDSVTHFLSKDALRSEVLAA